MKIVPWLSRFLHQRFFKAVCLSVLLIGFTAGLIGCGQTADEEKISDLDFTVVSPENIQEDIQKLINEKKSEAFQMTYSDGNCKYIVVGYGTQETGGYSIQVNEVYDTQNTICVRTTLLGPETEAVSDSVKSYPYIVLKIQNLDKTVVFK